jgi:hypothetical protein
MSISKVLAFTAAFAITATTAVAGFASVFRIQSQKGISAFSSSVVAVLQSASYPKGGSYYDVRSKATAAGAGGEVHHIPSFKAFNGDCALTHGKGPAIWMTVTDHRQTGSWGSSNDAIKYRDAQKQLIKQGKFKEAMDKDLADIRDKTTRGLIKGNYEEGIKLAVAYYQTIATQGLTAPKVTTPDVTTPDVDTP